MCPACSANSCSASRFGDYLPRVDITSDCQSSVDVVERAGQSLTELERLFPGGSPRRVNARFMATTVVLEAALPVEVTIDGVCRTETIGTGRIR